MRVLWISYLLIGCITCFPMGGEHAENSADPSFMWPSGSWFSGKGASSDPGSSSPLPSLPELYPNPSSYQAAGLLAPQEGFFWAGPGHVGSSNMAAGNAFDTGFAGFREGLNSPEVRAQEFAYAGPSAPDGSLGSAYDSWRPEPEDGYDAVEKLPEQVFSDISEMEPVSSLTSRSSYQRGRAVFARTHFAPGKLVRSRMPVARVITRTSERSGPVKVSTNGGF